MFKTYRWSAISAELPGRTDNEIKNHWHSHLKKRSKNNQVLRSESSTEVEKNKCDAKFNLAETNLPFSIVTEGSKPVGSVNITISPSSSMGNYSSSHADPAVQIDEYKTIEVIGSSETFGEFSSFWAQPFSVEDFQETYADPGYMVPISQAWCQEPASPYGFYDDLCSDLWFDLQMQAGADDVHF